MSALDRRLDRLAVVYRRPEACPACRFWGPCVYLRDDEAPRPETCPSCGRWAPLLLTRRYVIVRDAAGVAS